ncbi:MAG: NifU family protein [Porphyromonas sp.]|nr:NifU family protein [Porphyromonas sp.]
MVKTLLAEEIELVLRDKVSPLLRSHGGDLQLVKVEDRTVYVRFTGACKFCPAANETLEKVVQSALREHLCSEDVYLHLESGVSEDLWNEAKRILRKNSKI